MCGRLNAGGKVVAKRVKDAAEAAGTGLAAQLKVGRGGAGHFGDEGEGGLGETGHDGVALACRRSPRKGLVAGPVRGLCRGQQGPFRSGPVKFPDKTLS